MAAIPFSPIPFSFQFFTNRLWFFGGNVVNKVLRVQTVSLPGSVAAGGPRRQAERGMALAAINEF